MTHPIPNLSTRSGQIAHYAAIKRRLHGGKPKPKPKPLLLEVVKTDTQPPVCPSVSLVPLWKAHSIRFDDHISRWQWRMFSLHTTWLRDRCKEIGVDYEEIVGDSRKPAIVPYRQQLVWEMKEKFPHLSFPQIGRQFGDRDHTTMLHSIKRHKERMNAND